MKKVLVFALVAIMVLGLVACGAQGEKTKFVVGFDAEFPPYGYMDENGQYTGFDLELAEEVCKIYGWELVKQPIDWNSKDFELSSKAINCIWNGFTMTGREDLYTWTEPYVDNTIVIVTLASKNLTTLASLKGKNVAVQADSSAYSALTNKEDNDKNLALAASFAKLETVKDYNTAFANLESGLVDAVAVDIGVANYQLESRGASKFTIIEEAVAVEQYAVGFLLGNTELRDKVQTALDKLVENGTFTRLAQKYELTDAVCLGK